MIGNQHQYYLIVVTVSFKSRDDRQFSCLFQFKMFAVDNGAPKDNIQFVDNPKQMTGQEFKCPFRHNP